MTEIHKEPGPSYIGNNRNTGDLNNGDLIVSYMLKCILKGRIITFIEKEYMGN